MLDLIGLNYPNLNRTLDLSRVRGVVLAGAPLWGQSDRAFSFGFERLIVRFYGFRNGKLNNLICTKGIVTF